MRTLTKVKRRGIVVAAALVVILLVAGFAWFVLRDDSEPKRQQMIESLAISGSSLPSGLTATVLPDATLPLPTSEGDVTSLGPVVDVTPGGPLNSTATLEFTLDQPVATGEYVFVATKPSAEAEWEYREATVSPDGGHITVQTDHLSWWWPFKIDFAGLFEKAQREIIDALSGGATAQAQKPRCENEDAARQDGYKISHEGRGTLYWCFGIEDGERTLKITNRTRYPLHVDYSGFERVSAGAIQAELRHLARLTSGRDTILFPHDTAVYTTGLETDEEAVISTRYSGFAQSLHRFDIALQTLVQIMTKLGVDSLTDNARDSWGAIDGMLSGADCYNAAASLNIGKFIGACFTYDRLVSLFGLKGVLLSPFIAIGSVATWLLSEFDSIKDIVTDRDRYSVSVTRQENTIDRFVGTWHVHGSTVVINADGTGTEATSYGPCNDEHFCTQYATLAFAADGDTLVATYLDLRIEDEEGNPPFDVGAAYDIVGQSYVIRYVEEGLLERTMDNPAWAFGNPYLCTRGSQAAASGLCGA